MNTWINAAALVVAFLLPGCQTAQPNPAHRGIDSAIQTRNQGWAILYKTLDDESGVDKAMFLKSPSDQVHDLIKAIAKFAGDASKKIESLPKEDPSLDYSDQGLPEIEAKVRSALAFVTGGGIFKSGGKELEFNLLMCQHEALNYITKLAEVLAKDPGNDATRPFLTQLAKDSDALHDRVIELLKRPYIGTGR